MCSGEALTKPLYPRTVNELACYLMSSCMGDNNFVLPDKRRIGYAEYGSPNGETVLYFHGTPSSRLEPVLLNGYGKDIDGLAAQHGLRIVGIDRPGMGQSSFNPRGSFQSFAQDAVALADHLQLDTFKILCWSGGGSYSLAAAFHFPKRVTSVHIICGFSRSFSDPGVFNNMCGNKYFFGAARFIPWIMRPIMNIAGKKTPDRPLPNWLTQLKRVDHELLEDLSLLWLVIKVTLNEACQVDSKGLVHEARLYYGDTGYKLHEIKQPVHYWWGTEDNVVTQVHATSVEQQVPNSVMHYREGEAHLSLYLKHIEEILANVATAS